MDMRRLAVVLAAGAVCACAADMKQGQAQAPQPGPRMTGENAAVVDARQPPAPQPQQLPQAETQGAASPAQPAQSAQPAQPGQPGQSGLELASARIGNREALAFRVPFSGGSTRLELSPDAERTLATIALRAEKVQLRDSPGAAGLANFTLDLRDERMRAIRAFLVERGVAADRIEIAKPASTVLRRSGGAQGKAVVEILVLLPEPQVPR